MILVPDSAGASAASVIDGHGNIWKADSYLVPWVAVTLHAGAGFFTPSVYI